MKSRYLLCAFGLSMLSSPAWAADITGVWATGSEGGRVEIYRCGKALCGKLVDARRLRANPDLRDVRNADPKLRQRSEEHTSELQSLMRISYAVFCLKKKKHNYHDRSNI